MRDARISAEPVPVTASCSERSRFWTLRGWDRSGDAPFEWVQQITGPDIYLEYLGKHGEGFHHLGVNVTDMDESIKLMTARGAPPSQTAAWNTPRGKGRAVYVDTEPYGGVTLELIYDPR